MVDETHVSFDETEPLNRDSTEYAYRPSSSSTSTSTASAIRDYRKEQVPFQDDRYSSSLGSKIEPFDTEDGLYIPPAGRPMEKRTRRILWAVALLCVGGWFLSLVLFLSKGSYKHASVIPHDPEATASRGQGTGKKITLASVLEGRWRSRHHGISWIEGPNGDDGMLLEQGGGEGRDYLVVEDVRSRTPGAQTMQSITLMKYSVFRSAGQMVQAGRVWPSKDLKHVLVMSNEEKNWRHSFTGLYWIFDVETQSAEPLDPADSTGRIQLASWSPQSDAVVFTRENNMFLRRLGSSSVVPITMDGGKELFYGRPDWVYEEEVFSGNSATWWAEDGKYVAFLRTNETQVPTYPVQYFVKRPSGTSPQEGEENYPEERNIKYPKAGAPNPTVDLQFYDVEKGDVFSVEISGGLSEDDRLITEVFWAGSSGKVLIKEVNRESDILNVNLIDATRREGKVVRTDNVAEIDGGWYEPTQDTAYIRGDPNNGRPHDGYVDTIFREGYNHLAYFTPLENHEPVMLTTGKWEVEEAPSAVDLTNNLVYFVATKESSLQRHVYSVKLDGSDLRAFTDTSKKGYYGPSFSKGASYVLMSYLGPDIPWQKVLTTPTAEEQYSETIEKNEGLASLASSHDLPIEIYSTVTIDGYTLNVVERRPPHFNPKRKYPVLFWLYGGPGSQRVDRQFTVDFQSYVASALGYIVVTVDGRGTGSIGREARCIIRGNVGYYESRDQIETAKIWAGKPYVDPTRIAIWGWSYGGFLTLKTLEQDAGQTFSYGMAVAPVTDWRYYDSIYTERYMHTPQHNPEGYNNATISNVTALQQNVRFLLMHGVADDNVHMQNSLMLLDRLDLAGVENYDVHVFPDSDHGIYFHNANKMVYDRKFYPTATEG